MESSQVVSQALTLVLHQGSQMLLVPVVVALLALVLFTVFSVGAIIVELFAERAHFKANHERIVAEFRSAPFGQLDQVVDNAGLLNRQVRALKTVVRNMGLPDDELFALAEVEMQRIDTVYERRVNVTDTISKVAPMLGLMGTLIPLGPGIVAMGQGDVSALSSSLLIAFDTTVAGLVTAVVALVISRIHKTWYGQYHTVVQSLMSCLLEEAAIARDAGERLPFGPPQPGPGSTYAPAAPELSGDAA